MNDATTILANEATLVAQSVVDPAAFAAIYDHYFRRVYNYIRYRVRDVDITDDLTAQVFERALTNIGRYQAEKGDFAPWLFIIARNAVNDHLRTQKRRRLFSLDLLRDWATAGPQPHDIAVANESRAALLAAVAKLNERERDLIGLKFAAGLTNRRIAELTGLKEGNVGVILYRTLRRLRTMLKVEGGAQ